MDHLAFVEYAQARGFVVDPARVRHPKDKARVERGVPYVRRSFFAGEDFVDLADAQAKAERWCAEVVGLRVHGTTQRRPAEVFAAEEAQLLLPAPTEPYDVPIYARAKVHRDHHIEVARSLYSVSGELIGAHVEVRADRALVRISHRGQVVKVHPRQEPGQRSTDPAECPRTRPPTRCATSSTCAGWRRATGRPSAPTRPRCWTTRCRGRRCARSTGSWAWCVATAKPASRTRADAVDVGLVSRMLERAVEPETRPVGDTVVSARFARDASHFAVEGRDRPHPGAHPPAEEDGSLHNKYPARYSVGCGVRQSPTS